MRRVLLATLCVVIGSVLVGCQSDKVTSERSPFEIMQEKANAITEAGGLAAVGIGTSRTVSLALDKAKTRARTELAHILESKVESLKKDFTEEIGEGESAEYNALFSAASKTVASQTLRGSVPRDLKYKSEGSTTTAWALMVQDPKVIADAFADQKNSQRALYTRFRASQAFAELDKETKEFDEYKKQDAMMMK